MKHQKNTRTNATIRKAKRVFVALLAVLYTFWLFSSEDSPIQDICTTRSNVSRETPAASTFNACFSHCFTWNNSFTALNQNSRRLFHVKHIVCSHDNINTVKIKKTRLVKTFCCYNYWHLHFWNGIIVLNILLAEITLVFMVFLKNIIVISISLLHHTSTFLWLSFIQNHPNQTYFSQKQHKRKDFS